MSTILDPIEILFAYAVEGKDKRGLTEPMLAEIRLARSQAYDRLHRGRGDHSVMIHELKRVAVEKGLSLHRAEYAASVAHSIQLGACTDKLASYAMLYCETILPMMQILEDDGVGAKRYARKLVASGVRVGLREAADICERVMSVGQMRLLAVGFAQTLRAIAEDGDAMKTLSERDESVGSDT